MTNTTDLTSTDVGLPPTDPRWLAYRDMQQRQEDEAPKTIPPCPAWCAEPGLDYDSTDVPVDGQPLTYLRTHISSKSAQACVWQEERNTAGVVTFGEPSVWLKPDSDDLTADEAVGVATDLLNAVALLRKLEADQP